MSSVDPALALEIKALSQWREVREADEKGDSDIQTLFKGAVVFITGGTGFLGKQLTEKLFRSCRDIKKVYLLSRSKKGKTMQERLTKTLKDPVYDQVRERVPDFESRIIPVEGDILELRLGIKDDDWKILLEEVNFIYHVAATVRFDEPLKTAILANVRGTKEALTLARECHHLRSFVHVSTAYSHCNRKEVVEKFYDSPVPPQTMIDFVENVEEAKIDALTPALIEGWPNTYTFSKAIAEEAVRTMGRGLPVCVVRPAIVIPSYREPTPGWLDFSNVLGPSGIVLGTHVGIVHTMLMDKTTNVDVVPVDYVNNLIVAASWETATRRTRQSQETQETHEDCRVYTLSRFRNRVNWQKLREHSETVLRKYVSPRSVWYCYALPTASRLLFFIYSLFLHFIPALAIDAVLALKKLREHSETVLRKYVSPRSVWYCYALPTASRLLFFIYSLFLHFIPALAIDAVLALSGNKFRVHKIYDKAYKLNSILGYFMLQTWDMRDDNTLSLYNRLSKTDKTIFCFEMTTVEFPAFLTYWWLGLRKHILKDDLKNTEEAYKKQQWLKIANFVFYVVYFWLIWLVVSWLYSFVSFIGGQEFGIFSMEVEIE